MKLCRDLGIGLYLLGHVGVALAQENFFSSEYYVAPLELEDEGPIVPKDYAHDLFIDTGFVIRGNTTTGEEFHLWLFWYRQLGEEEFIINNDIMQASLLYGNFSDTDRKRMNDISFINVGQNLEDYHSPDTLQFSQDANHVAWTFEKISITAYKDGWVVQGSYADVDVDLKIKARGDEFYHAGKFEDLKGCANATTATNYNCSGVAGGIVHVYATGTINGNGTHLTIDQAQGVHEHLVQAYDVPKRVDAGVGRGSLWLHGWGDKFSWWTFTADIGPFGIAMVNVGNETSATGGVLNVTIETRNQWIDPKTDQLNPAGWHTTAVFEHGVLEADVQSFGRVYYYWLRNGALLFTNQFTADMTMTWTPHDGEAQTDRGGAFMEYMKNVYVQPKWP
ncbi:hypothetical protein BDW75DRAFT_243406 [Aspergillus navahoensis]